MPYMVPVVCAAMMTAVDLPGAVPVSTLEIVTHQFYPILLLVMTIFAIVSGLRAHPPARQPRLPGERKGCALLTLSPRQPLQGGKGPQDIAALPFEEYPLLLHALHHLVGGDAACIDDTGHILVGKADGDAHPLRAGSPYWAARLRRVRAMRRSA